MIVVSVVVSVVVSATDGSLSSSDVQPGRIQFHRHHHHQHHQL